ncbi:MAG: SRPBCC family protein [Nocardioidaceae bacterium]|nr:SRPBCC family protein [Marmoricola sp.]
MSIVSVDVDGQALTMTVLAQFGVPVCELWDAYLDPRIIEQFWGPPTFPAIFSRHDGCAGGRSHYTMTGPEGERHGGYWEWSAVDPGRSFEVRDGFADQAGVPNQELPSMRMIFSFDAQGEGSRVSTTTYFNSSEELAQLLGMGMDEGMRAAMGQIDGVLANRSAFESGASTQTQILADDMVRISRVVQADLASVWRAHNESSLVKQWMLGPEGWEMPICEVAEQVGDIYRYVWAQVDGPDRFGFTGTLLEMLAPYRAVTTEEMIDIEGPQTRNELTLTPVAGGTLVSNVITYPDQATRDAILATGMTHGMEASYVRLESLLSTSDR